jgi:hypothetical protein
VAVGIRFGLCCQFLDHPIRFRTATHRYVASLPRKERRVYLGAIARDNAVALGAAVAACHQLGIGAFRINSQFLPLATHPVSGYSLAAIDETGETAVLLDAARESAQRLDTRLSFHPDQFVVLNSERADVVASAVRELHHQGDVAELIGADTIVLHAGALSGGMTAALDRLERGIERLNDAPGAAWPWRTTIGCSHRRTCSRSASGWAFRSSMTCIITAAGRISCRWPKRPIERRRRGAGANRGCMSRRPAMHGGRSIPAPMRT